MPEELSPGSKLYIKEEIEKVRKEFKDDLKDAQSKATKTFATIVMIVGLLGSLGIYGLVKSALNNTTITNLEKVAEGKRDKIVEYEKDANDILSKLEQARLEQNSDPNGYAWVGNIKIVWGTEKSTGQNQKFQFKHAFDKECFAVVTDLRAYAIEKTADHFTLRRHAEYAKYLPKVDFNFIAIGH